MCQCAGTSDFKCLHICPFSNGEFGAGWDHIQAPGRSVRLAVVSERADQYLVQTER